MHQLEQEALDDPFLMDALEGYEVNGKDQQGNLSELTDRLLERTAEKRGRVISWKVWSIAASILVVLTIGGLWLKNSSPIPQKERVADVVQQTKVDKAQTVTPKDTAAPASPAKPVEALVAQNIKPAPVLKSINQSVAKPSDNAVYQQEISATDNKQATSSAVASPDDLAKKVPPAAANYGSNEYKPAAPVSQGFNIGSTDKKDNTQRLSEAVVLGYTSQSKKDSLDNNRVFGNSKAVKTYGSSRLPGKVDGLTVIPADPKSQAEASRISGIIIAKGDGSPIIGAAIRIKGTNKSTVTDTNGKFALSASPASDETLDIASIGFERKQIHAKVGDSLKVELNDASSSLNEVVVTRNRKDADEEPPAENAHPQNSWSSFKKYLQSNAVLPDGAIGNVNVTFTVAADGSLGDFKIKKSLNAIADQKAIDLIKNGPSWIGNNNQKTEQVTVKVKFQKQK
jgi:outer membrane biosynthesis protein TonB